MTNNDQPTLWVFGHSLCLPFSLDQSSTGWAEILAGKLGYKLKNFAKPAVDNFYIYCCYLENQKKISKQDLVIIGWSHYSRKLFTVNRNNSEHVKIFDQSLQYTCADIEFMRNRGKASGDPSKWVSLKPIDKGIFFYDNWYKNYYSEFEQKINFQSYLHSTSATCSGTYLPFYFSKESVEGVDIDQVHAGYVTEFIIENNLSISEKDFHFSEHGHATWAKHLEKYLTLV